MKRLLDYDLEKIYRELLICTVLVSLFRKCFTEAMH